MDRSAVLALAGLLVAILVTVPIAASQGLPAWVRPGACVSINVAFEKQGQAGTDAMRVTVVGVQGDQIALEVALRSGQKQQVVIGADGTVAGEQGRAPFFFLFLPPVLEGRFERTGDGRSLIMVARQGDSTYVFLYDASTRMFEAAVSVVPSNGFKAVAAAVDNNFGAPLLDIPSFVGLAERNLGTRLPAPPERPLLPCGGSPQQPPTTDAPKPPPSGGGGDAALIIGGIIGVMVVAGIAMRRRSPPLQPPAYQQRYAQQASACPSCGYPLRGHENVCPNCGYRLRQGGG